MPMNLPIPDRVPRAAMLAIAGLIFAMSAALAQVKPYERASVSFKPAETDAAFTAMIARLREAVAKEDMSVIDALLADSLQVIVCKTDPLSPCAPGASGVKSADRSKPAAQRLRETLCCPGIPAAQITDELRRETIAGHIAGALESGQTTGHEMSGLVCMPSWAIYDRNKARAIVQASGSDPQFLRYASADIEYRDKADPKAAPAGTIAKGDLVPMLSDVATQMPDGWYAIALPGGTIGYSDALGLEELTPSGTCFRKDASGWKIALVMAIE